MLLAIVCGMFYMLYMRKLFLKKEKEKKKKTLPLTLAIVLLRKVGNQASTLNLDSMSETQVPGELI